MANSNDNDHDHDNRDPNPNPDRSRQNQFLTTTSLGGLASLESLGAVLNKVNTSAAAGRSGLPMLQFKRPGNWLYGQRGTEVEEGSHWAADPRSFRWGYICFGGDSKVIGERLVPVSQPMPDHADLPGTGFKWNEQWSVNLKCLDGSDAGVEVVYPATTRGGIQAIAGLIEAIRDRINGAQHGGNIVPVFLLDKDSYQHQQYGRVWVPVLTIDSWMSLDGPAPAEADPPRPPSPPSPPPRPPSSPAASAAEQPRRRRVA